MFWRLKVIMVIGIDRQYVLPLLQMLDLFFSEDDGTVLRPDRVARTILYSTAQTRTVKLATTEQQDTILIDRRVLGGGSG